MALQKPGFIRSLCRSLLRFRYRSALALAPVIAALVFATTSYAEIYKSTNDSGGAVFSDVKSNQSNAVALPPTNTHTPVQTENLFKNDTTDPAPSQTVVYETLTIQSPSQDQIFRNNAGQVGVSVTVTPALQSNHQIQILLDGMIVAESQSGNQFSLNELPRGAHSVSAQVIDPTDGSILITSPTIQFHIKSHSVLHFPKPKPQPPVNNN